MTREIAQSPLEGVKNGICIVLPSFLPSSGLCDLIDDLLPNLVILCAPKSICMYNAETLHTEH